MEIQVKLSSMQRNCTKLFTALFGVLAYLLVKDNTIWSMVLGVILTLMFKNITYVYAFFMTVGRDMTNGYRFFVLSVFLLRLNKKQWSVARIFQQRCREHPAKPCLLIDDRILTFNDVEVYTNKVGTCFKERGFRKGDCVALLMATRPEYVATFLGLSKVGLVTALINTNLRRETLLHSIKVAKAQAIILGTELVQAFQDIADREEIKSIPVYQLSDEENSINANMQLIKGAYDLNDILQKQTPADLSVDINDTRPEDKMLYVYTSGTTGMPKAAVVTNLRYLFMTAAVHFITGIRQDDIVYNCLPLYHSAGGTVGIGNALIHGCTVALRKKFSATNYWKDCIKYNATCAQYIGELCRYLLNSPARPEDSQHKVRLMFGNGLRKEIWLKFTTRFNIPSIGELYGSTEGNSNLVNATNKVGAIGFIPIFCRSLFPVQVIRVDEEAGEPVRNADGFSIRCNPGETGLVIGKVDPARAMTAFHGYADKEATDKKLLRDVFKKGDLFFNSGDMVVGDILGFFYFKDRSGDTFRWRGENVSTQEVEAIITNVIKLQDCVVYGVEIPHIEGKAGMAAIEDPDRKFDLQQLSLGISCSLPSYARPLFVRVMDQIPRTATFKMKKRDLIREGFDMDKIKDPLYYLNKDGVYRPFTREQYDSLLNGTSNL